MFAYMCVLSHVCAGTGVVDDCESPCACWEWNPGLARASILNY